MEETSRYLKHEGVIVHETREPNGLKHYTYFKDGRWRAGPPSNIMAILNFGERMTGEEVARQIHQLELGRTGSAYNGDTTETHESEMLE